MSRHTGLSLYPSVWRESGCESHYIIWNDKIFLFGRYEDNFDSATETYGYTQLVEAVSERLSDTGLISFSDIAEDLGEVPWDVLMVCRRLVRKGFAREGVGEQRGSFGRL
ncbi:MAG: hypothetical protein HY940_02305 [Gammaproteobacteria bacterium]|nr:hypothetical protein [Gammaproteobacteria bacterium]